MKLIREDGSDKSGVTCRRRAGVAGSLRFDETAVKQINEVFSREPNSGPLGHRRNCDRITGHSEVNPPTSESNNSDKLKSKLLLSWKIVMSWNFQTDTVNVRRVPAADNL